MTNINTTAKLLQTGDVFDLFGVECFITYVGVDAFGMMVMHFSTDVERGAPQQLLIVSKEQPIVIRKSRN